MENLFIGIHGRFQCLTFIIQLNLLFSGQHCNNGEGGGIWAVRRGLHAEQSPFSEMNPGNASKLYRTRRKCGASQQDVVNT